MPHSSNEYLRLHNFTMAEYCKDCSLWEDKYDIDLFWIATTLKKGRSENFICEGCNMRVVFKDENGQLYLGKDVDGEIVLTEVRIEELM